MVNPLIFASAAARILPLEPMIRNDSTLFLLKMISMLSVVPMKLVHEEVPVFPVSPHPHPDAAAQRALPDASEVRT